MTKKEKEEIELEITASLHLIDLYDEWKWERDNPEDRIHYDWSDPNADYKIEETLRGETNDG